MWAVTVLAAVWLLACGAYLVAKHQRVTAEKVRTYLRSVDLGRLTGNTRAQALRELARQLNALPYEERRRARLDQEWRRWFLAMTDAEKSEFIESTLPTGFRQMLGAFEQLEPDRRRRTIDEAVKRLREARSQLDGSAEPGLGEGDTNALPIVSEEVRQTLITTGLKSFYGESSAQTKAEAAPLLEELQRMMESGALLRGR